MKPHCQYDPRADGETIQNSWLMQEIIILRLRDIVWKSAIVQYDAYKKTSLARQK